MQTFKQLCSKAALCLMAATSLVFVGCQNGKSKESKEIREIGDKYRGYFENEKAVDFSDLLKTYQSRHSFSLSDYEWIKDSLGYNYEGTEIFALHEYTAFAVQLPQYANSKQPFLAYAETFYNACLLAFNVWSNQDMNYLGAAEIDDIVEAVNSISEECIRDSEVRAAATAYKSEMRQMILNRPEFLDEDDEVELDESSLMAFGEHIDAKVYKYFSDGDQFADSLQAMRDELVGATKSTFKLYLDCESTKRVELMLRELNDCGTFDEQCSLFLNWANSKEAEPEDDWIVAVADRLMHSGKYNPCLDSIWRIWRCLFQYMYCGIGINSAIPNDLYNVMRKKCYLTCLSHIEKYPDDMFAMYCAASIGGRPNINHFGQYYFGNDAALEKHTLLSGREDEE